MVQAPERLLGRVLNRVSLIPGFVGLVRAMPCPGVFSLLKFGQYYADADAENHCDINTIKMLCTINIEH